MLDKEFYTVRDLQALSGEAEPTWRKRISRREISVVYFGANVRVPAAELRRWLEAHTVLAKGAQ
jgi:hypothetical protein